MSGHADAGPSVSVARAIEIATSRLAVYDAAIDVLGVNEHVQRAQRAGLRR